MNRAVTIKVGEQGSDFLKRHRASIKTWQSLPGVVQDYLIDWDVRNRGTVRVEHREHSFVIEHVISVLTSQDIQAQANDGLDEFNITAGLTNVSGTAHDEARLRTYEILQAISAAGWKNTIDVSDPRISGKDRFDFALSSISNMFIGLDLQYVPDIQEWMRIEDGTAWRFYANGLYMEVSFRRSPDHMDLNQLGVYQLSFNIKTATEYFRSFAGPDNRHRWKEVVPGKLVNLAKIRAEKETELRAKGIPIDESYQDPPIPKFD